MPGAMLIMGLAIAIMSNVPVEKESPAGDRLAVEEPVRQPEEAAPVCALSLDSLAKTVREPPKVTTVDPPERLEADAEAPPAPQRPRTCGRPLPAQS